MAANRGIGIRIRPCDGMAMVMVMSMPRHMMVTVVCRLCCSPFATMAISTSESRTSDGHSLGCFAAASKRPPAEEGCQIRASMCADMALPEKHFGAVFLLDMGAIWSTWSIWSAVVS